MSEVIGQSEPQDIITEFRKTATSIREALDAGVHPRKVTEALLGLLVEANSLASRFEFRARLLRREGTALWQESGKPAFEESSSRVQSGIIAVREATREAVFDVANAAAETREAWTAATLKAADNLESIAEKLQEGLGDAPEDYLEAKNALGITRPNS